MVRIEEVQKSTIVQVLDPPEVPNRKVRPIPVRIYFYAIAFGLIIPLVYIVFREWYMANKDDLLDYKN